MPLAVSGSNLRKNLTEILKFFQFGPAASWTDTAIRVAVNFEDQPIHSQQLSVALALELRSIKSTGSIPTAHQTSIRMIHSFEKPA
jgi:hypothetical protein